MLDEEEEGGGDGIDATAPDAEYDYSALADAFDDSASEGESGSGSGENYHALPLETTPAATAARRTAVVFLREPFLSACAGAHMSPWM